LVHPLFDAAKRMLHYFTALPQDFRIRFQPRFHPIQHRFIDPACDLPIGVGGTATLELEMPHITRSLPAQIWTLRCLPILVSYLDTGDAPAKNLLRRISLGRPSAGTHGAQAPLTTGSKQVKNRVNDGTKARSAAVARPAFAAGSTGPPTPTAESVRSVS
jgi:hypothetical protein